MQTPDYMRIIEQCVQLGRPCLCQNIKEDLDPSLNPILTKSVKKIGMKQSTKYLIKNLFKILKQDKYVL